MRSRKTHAVVGLLAVGALVAGCGGGLSEGEYREEVEGVLTPLGEELQTIGTDTTSQTTPEGVADGLGDAEAALETGVGDLEEIEPPDELQEPHDSLVTVLSDFEEATAGAREGAESGDLEAVGTEYVTAATDFQQQLTEVVQEFQDAGLELQPQPTQ
jgi:hypothetical protein